MIPGTKEFFIAAKDHDEWGSAHTVWGMVGCTPALDLSRRFSVSMCVRVVCISHLCTCLLSLLSVCEDVALKAEPCICTPSSGEGHEAV